MSGGFVFFMILLVVAASASSDGRSVASPPPVEEKIKFVEPEEPPREQQQVIVSETQSDQDGGAEVTVSDAADEEAVVVEQEASTKTRSKKATAGKIPVLEPDIDRGPIDDKTREDLIEKFGGWHFWDGDEEMRPKEDYLVEYPHKDIPGEKFPDNSWQVDAVYVNHFINDADKLISRAKEAIFSEYGHGKPLPPEAMAERMKMFHWEKIDLATANGPPASFQKRGEREIGGWTTKRSFDGLVRRLLHAMLTKDTFTVVLAGHSAAQGQGNHFRQSYMMQFHKIMKPIFERLGVKLITRNMSQGGLGTLQGGMGAGSIYGDEMDIFLWDSGMTENFAPHHIELVLRQALIGGNRVPLLWGGPFEVLKFLHNEVDADVGEWGTGYAGLPTTSSEVQSLTLPWAARNMVCDSEVTNLCKENRYNVTCWIDRPDEIKPIQGQRDRPRGQVSWHPGWRPHQLMGRVLAFSVLEALDVALNKWMESTMSGQPLDDEYWHMTEYYDNIRNKLANLDEKSGKCGELDGTLPLRLCKTPMKALTQYTPRANFVEGSITGNLKPAPDGSVAKNQLKPLYDGPDVHNPSFDLPEGAVDVLGIVSGRRRLASEDDIRTKTPAERSDVDLKEENSTPRRLDDIVPGKGWEVALEPQGYCDGTYDATCSHSGYEECFLLGHHDGRGAVVGSEYSGWLVMTLKDVKEGLIVVKLHTWHYESENPITKQWKSVNNEGPETASRRLGQPAEAASSTTENFTTRTYEWDSGFPDDDEAIDQDGRRLKIRDTKCPELPNEFSFDFAINGKITSWNREQFLEKKQDLQRVVEMITLLDDPSFKSETVELAIRLRGVQRLITFGITHVYWA